MRMRSLSLLLLSALCCFPASGFAATDGYFLRSKPDVFFETAAEVCTSVIPDLINTTGITITGVSHASTYNGCVFTYTVNSDGTTGSGGFNMTGNVPALINQYTCQADEPASITWPLGPRDTSFPNNVNPATATVPPFPVCSAGCKVAKVSVDSCYAINDQVPTFMHCDYNVKKTGETCSTADTAPKPDTSKCPPGTVLSGSSCVAEPPPDPCIDNPTGPGCTPPVDPCVANPSGPGCTPPVDPCVANPSGAGCPGGGTDPGDGTDPGGGTTPGTGTGPGTGAQPAPGSAGGLACGDTFICSGDSVGCVTAELEKIQMCNGARNSDYSGAGKTAIGEAMKDPDGDLEESEVHLASIISGHVRFLPSTCPPPQSFTVFGRQFAFSNDMFCNFAISISWLVVAMASLTAALYIGQSFGSS